MPIRKKIINITSNILSAPARRRARKAKKQADFDVTALKSYRQRNGRVSQSQGPTRKRELNENLRVFELKRAKSRTKRKKKK